MACVHALSTQCKDISTRCQQGVNTVSPQRNVSTMSQHGILLNVLGGTSKEPLRSDNAMLAVDRISPELGKTWPHAARTWSNRAIWTEIGQTLTQSGQRMAKFGQCLANFGPNCPIWEQLCSMLANLDPNLASALCCGSKALCCGSRTPCQGRGALRNLTRRHDHTLIAGKTD